MNKLWIIGGVLFLIMVGVFLYLRKKKEKPEGVGPYSAGMGGKGMAAGPAKPSHFSNVQGGTPSYERTQT